MNGVTMQRVIGLVVASFAFSSLSGVPAVAHMAGSTISLSGLDQGRHRGAPVDVAALLTAAKGAPPMICSLAAKAVQGWGWGGWNDADGASSANGPTKTVTNNTFNLISTGAGAFTGISVNFSGAGSSTNLNTISNITNQLGFTGISIGARFA